MFSLWAWLFLAPFAITSLGGYATDGPLDEVLLGLAVAIIVHGALAAAFAIAARAELRIPAGPWRLAWVGAVVAALAALRPALLSTMRVMLDLPPVDTPELARYATNLCVLGGAIVVTHLWLRASDRSVRARAALAAVLRERSAATAAAERATDAVVAEFTDAIAAPVRRALEEARVEPFDAARQAERLRRVAHDVVRPLSHHVFDAGIGAADPVGTPTTSVERSATVPPARFPTRARAAPAWMPVTALMIIAAPVLLCAYPMPSGLGRIAASALIGLGAGGLLRLIPAMPVRFALPVLAVGYALVGAAMSLPLLDLGAVGVRLPQPRISAVSDYWLVPALGAMIIGVLTALGVSLLDEADGANRSLRRAVAFASARAAEARARHAETTDAVARILHNLVQGEIIATSLQLRMGVVGPEAVDELIERVDAILREPADERAMQATSEEVRDAANAAIVSWTRVMDVDSRADPDAWRWLATRPGATALFQDAQTEALTNASRHAAAPRADLELLRTADGVRLLAATPGRLGAQGTGGIGLSDLRRRGAHAALAQDGDDRVLLTVDITDEVERRAAGQARWANADS